MASRFVIAATADAPDYWPLDESDEEALTMVLRNLAPYTAPVGRAALVHERDGAVISAWDEAGARRLAQALPPAYAALAAAIGSRYGTQ